MRLAPRSLPGQMAAILALALLVSQSLNFGLLLQSRQKLQDASDDVAIGRFVAIVERSNSPSILRERLTSDRRRSRWDDRLTVTTEPLALQYDQRKVTTRRLQAALRDAGMQSENAIVAEGIYQSRRRDRHSPMLVFSAPLSEQEWLNFSQPLRPEPPLPWAALVGQTLVIYFALLAGVLFFARRMTKSLSRLTDAAQRIMTPDAPPALTPEGPDDIRALTTAFEDMRARIRRLFEEKDVMLGAIGHDLRTPLTSLRIRVESVDNDRLREGMIKSVEELSMMLDDILSLARNGHVDGEVERFDVAHLIADVMSEMAQHTDRLTVHNTGGPCTADGFPVLLKRAVRNLIDNGLRHGEHVTVAARCEENFVIISVEDDGPGVPDEDLPRIREAFVRGEQSRNRQTGGAGLGLALVDGVTQAHGGTLELKNRAEGGFCAVIRLPAAADRT
ncbi:ATP-binding protein [Parvularcula sp. LCG005]|uniref:ATP-binding protein n=1 Tax=Parvularcula sp. LCG005 TaxID=3078805 RepID=UPI0029433843|nr:ATP-binding protein [Parvularcula sp. LCG005]WOI53792.1 ATP-binding protein [Parvularcula sp. LCG005]